MFRLAFESHVFLTISLHHLCYLSYHIMAELLNAANLISSQNTMTMF